ncbi:MAG: hypothetical protein AAGI01_12820 [Myxococcota bacterium]
MSTSEQEEEVARTRRQRHHDVIIKVAESIDASPEKGGLTNGARAELRRLNAESPSAATFWRLVVAYELPEGVVSRWAVLFRALVTASRTLDRRVPLGAALASAGYSELRLTRLLEARDRRLRDEVRRLGDYFHSKHQPVDWRDACDLLMNEDDWIRRRIARSYFGRLHREQDAS